MTPEREAKIREYATKLSALNLRHECLSMVNTAGKTAAELAEMRVEDALLVAEINDMKLLLALESQGVPPSRIVLEPDDFDKFMRTMRGEKQDSR